MERVQGATAQYEELILSLDAFLVRQKQENNIGEGVASTACLRMSALICGGLAELTKEEFLGYASDAWDMSAKALDKARNDD